MKTNTLIKMSLLATFAININASVLYDKESVKKTKEVYMLSQLLSDGNNLPIKITGDTTGGKSLISSFFAGKDKDEDWFGKVTLDVKVGHCATPENVQMIENSGLKIKSRIGDGYIAGLRESTKFLKNNGANYILIGVKLLKQTDGQPKIKKGEKFSEILDKGLQAPESIMFSGQMGYEIPDQCYNKSTALADWLWVGGQVASLALGVAGAKSGNTNLTSLAAHSSVATNNTSNLLDGSGVNDSESKFASSFHLFFYGVKTPTFFEDHPRRKGDNVTGALAYQKDEWMYQYEGYLFPIEEVEEHLSKYMDIPYSTSIKNN